MNLARALLATAATAADRRALVTPGEDLSYGVLAERAGGLAAEIGERCRPGDRVAIVAGNEVGFVVAYLAGLATGAVVVPLNPNAPAPELHNELATAEPTAIVTTLTHEDAARDVATQTPLIVVGDERATFEPVERDPRDAAAFLFTSGTAGAPRPAILTHGSLLANLEQVQQHPGL